PSSETEPASNSRVQVYAPRQSPVIIIQRQALHVENASGDVVLGTGKGARNRKIVLMTESLPQTQVDPIRPPSWLVEVPCGLRDDLWIAYRFELEELLARHHVRYVDVALHSYEPIVGETRSPVRASFRGYQYDAVGTAGTINGGRRGILQHLYRGYIIDVDVPQGAAVGHTVEDDQRIVACCYGIPAPDQNRLARRSPCGRGLYHDPRYGSLNDLAKRAIAHQLQSFNGDGGDGTGDIAPPLRAVTDDDYLITLICFLEELETHGRSLAVYHYHFANLRSIP